MGKQKQATKGTGWTGEGYPFRTLPDYLQPGLDLVFVGINPGLYSVQRRHYFARLTSRFWTAFSASKLSERVRRALGTDTLRAEHDAELLRFGIGFTDVVKPHPPTPRISTPAILRNGCRVCSRNSSATGRVWRAFTA